MNEPMELVTGEVIYVCDHPRQMLAHLLELVEQLRTGQLEQTIKVTTGNDTVILRA